MIGSMMTKTARLSDRWTALIFILLLIAAPVAAQDPETPAEPPLSFGTRDGNVGSNELVLIHGLGSSAAVWDQMIEPLKLGLKVWAFEFPGHGRTQPIADTTLESLVELLGDYLHQNKIEYPILVGHGMGGMVALQYALENPAAVYKLIMIDSAPIQLASAEQKLSVAQSLAADYDHFVAEYFLNMSPRQEVTDRILDQAMRTHQATFTQLLLSSFDFDLTEDLLYQSLPILVIGSSMMFPDPHVAQAQLDQMGFANARTISFKSMPTGHFVMLEEPRYLASVILAFSVSH